MYIRAGLLVFRVIEWAWEYYMYIVHHNIGKPNIFWAQHGMAFETKNMHPTERS